MTFEANVALGATRERIESGVKQWFAWYDKKYSASPRPRLRTAWTPTACSTTRLRTRERSRARPLREGQARGAKRDRKNN